MLQTSAVHLVVVRQDFLRAQGFVQNRAASKELHLCVSTLCNVIAIHAAQDALGGAFRHVRLRVVLVIERQIVEPVFHLLVHAPDSILDNDRNFVGERRVVAVAGGNGACEYQAMAVLVLQSFARERGASTGSAHQETLAARVGESPDQIPDALEPEHRIVGEERDHRDAVVGVSGARRCERRHGASLVDAFFENLAVLGFPIKQEIFAITGL